MASEVAGFTPEHEVHGSKRSRILCIILCVTAIALVGLAIAVTLVITYAPVAPGLLVYPDNVVYLEGGLGENTGKQYYVQAMNAFVDTRQSSYSAHLRDCSYSDGPNNQYDCNFDLNWVYDVCSAQKDDWGYRLNSPCFLLVFNEPMDWVPEPYESPTDLPMEMPESLRRHIEDVFVDKDQTTTDFLWVSCTGETPADAEYLGTAELHPWRGIPFMYFPVHQDSPPQTIPLLALKLNNPQRGVLISIRCHFWAKNLDSQHIAARIQLLV